MPLVITIEIAVHNICDTINIKKKKLVYVFSFIKKKKRYVSPLHSLLLLLLIGYAICKKQNKTLVIIMP